MRGLRMEWGGGKSPGTLASAVTEVAWLSSRQLEGRPPHRKGSLVNVVEAVAPLSAGSGV